MRQWNSWKLAVQVLAWLLVVLIAAEDGVSHSGSDGSNETSSHDLIPPAKRQDIDVEIDVALDVDSDVDLDVDLDVDPSIASTASTADHSFSTLQEKDNLYGIHSIPDLEEALKQSPLEEPLLVVLAYKFNCPASVQLLQIFKEASVDLQSSLKYPRFAQLPAIPNNLSLLEQLNVKNVPAILLIKQQQQQQQQQQYLNADTKAKPVLHVLEYVGLQSTRDELVAGLQHYLTRLEHSNSRRINDDYKALSNKEYLELNLNLNSLTIRVESIPHIERIVSQQQILQHIPTPLDPLLSDAEMEWVRFLLNENDNLDPLFVICQCRHGDSPSPLPSSYAEFDQVASVLSLRRDVLFCVLTHCDTAGTVSVHAVVEDEDWTLQLLEESTSWWEGSNTALPSISNFITQTLLPNVLWLDRQATAPIAFAPQYKLHAVLFIDFHSMDLKENMRATIQDFREECRRYKKDHSQRIVCLVVPSTDTRVLTTFGIDMWTRLDDKAGRKTKEDARSALPSLLITDQRAGVGIQRYYLDPPFEHSKMETFFREFALGQTPLEMKSARHVNGSNAHNVQLLTAQTLQSFVDRGKHTLVLLYAPACGHCKRFNHVWNDLGDLIAHLEWDDKLELARLDVGSNEFFIPGMAVHLLPDIFYFGPDSPRSPIPYTEGEVGGISDPLDIIEWWLSVAKNGHVGQQQLLNSLEQSHESQPA
jgi:hypothetical protein